MMKPEIVTKPAFHVLGYALVTNINEGANHREIPAFWERYIREGLRANIPNKLNPEVELGVCADFNPASGELTYLIGYEVESLANVPEGLTGCTIPEADYAVFTTPPVDSSEFSAAIQQTWGSAFGEWFPRSEYQPKQAIQFEWYDGRSAAGTSAQMDIYIPIEPKAVEVPETT